MFEGLLKKQFDHVVKVTDGQQAIDAVLSKPINHFNMIILDIGMEPKGGVEACREICQYFEEAAKSDANNKIKAKIGSCNNL